jgi:hypothetical protein
LPSLFVMEVLYQFSRVIDNLEHGVGQGIKGPVGEGIAVDQDDLGSVFHLPDYIIAGVKIQTGEYSNLKLEILVIN